MSERVHGYRGLTGEECDVLDDAVAADVYGGGTRHIADAAAELKAAAQAEVANAFVKWAAKNEVAEPPLDWAWFGEIARRYSPLHEEHTAPTDPTGAENNEPEEEAAHG